MQKKLVDQIADECTETIEEVKLAKITLPENENSCKCSFCTVYTMLFWVFFTIDVGEIRAYFVYFHGYLKRCLLVKQQSTKHINVRSQTNYH